MVWRKPWETAALLHPAELLRLVIVYGELQYVLAYRLAVLRQKVVEEVEEVHAVGEVLVVDFGSPCLPEDFSHVLSCHAELRIESERLVSACHYQRLLVYTFHAYPLSLTHRVRMSVP